jgi:hypothetical protein
MEPSAKEKAAAKASEATNTPKKGEDEERHKEGEEKQNKITEMVSKSRPHIRMTHDSGLALQILADTYVERTLDCDEGSVARLLFYAAINGNTTLVSKTMAACRKAKGSVYDYLRRGAGPLRMALQAACLARCAEAAREIFDDCTYIDMSVGMSTSEYDAYMLRYICACGDFSLLDAFVQRARRALELSKYGTGRDGTSPNSFKYLKEAVQICVLAGSAQMLEVFGEFLEKDKIAGVCTTLLYKTQTHSVQNHTALQWLCANTKPKSLPDSDSAMLEGDIESARILYAYEVGM